MWNSCNQGNQWWFGRLLNWWLIIKIEGSGICTLKDVTDPGWICRTTDSVDPSGKCWDRRIRRSIYWFIDPPIHWYTDLLIWGELPPLSLFLPSPIKQWFKVLFSLRSPFRVISGWFDHSGIPVQVSHNPLWLCHSFCWKTGNQYLSTWAHLWTMYGRCFIVHFFIF